MRWNAVLLLLSAVLLYNGADAILCHRCYSAMGGCGDDLVWWMFPWKDCGDSEFCVKVIEKVGSDHTIIRECENNLLKSTKHRLQMPGLRRHGYCLPARKNSAANPLVVEDKNIEYCFCNDWNGCNSARGLSVPILPVVIISTLVTVLVSRFK